MIKKIEKEAEEVLNEQVKEIIEEAESLEELDEDRTVNTQDFGNTDEGDIKSQEIEELIDQEEERRKSDE